MDVDRSWLPGPTLGNDLLADNRNLKGIQIWPVAVVPILDCLAGCVVRRAIHRQWRSVVLDSEQFRLPRRCIPGTDPLLCHPQVDPTSTQRFVETLRCQIIGRETRTARRQIVLQDSDSNTVRVPNAVNVRDPSSWREGKRLGNARVRGYLCDLQHSCARFLAVPFEVIVETGQLNPALKSTLYHLPPSTTGVPIPRRRTSIPLSTSSWRARRTVGRDSDRCCASDISLSSFAPGRSAPVSIASSIRFAS